MIALGGVAMASKARALTAHCGRLPACPAQRPKRPAAKERTAMVFMVNWIEGAAHRATVASSTVDFDEGRTGEDCDGEIVETEGPW